MISGGLAGAYLGVERIRGVRTEDQPHRGGFAWRAVDILAVTHSLMMTLRGADDQQHRWGMYQRRRESVRVGCRTGGWFMMADVVAGCMGRVRWPAGGG